MGVKQLWGILEPARKKEQLDTLRGKVICVDLSAWICQAEETIGLKHAVLKPYLRHTIFRVICLKRLGTRLIFVTEGKPPQLKWDAIVARVNARKELDNCQEPLNGHKLSYAARGRGKKGWRVAKKSNNTKENNGNAQPTKVGRSHFQRKINECKELLEFLGIPVVKSEGEAEACCALLNRKDVADGCITEDGDTFLYGGKVVYKNLTISGKDPHVHSYSMEDVRTELNMDREHMIALGLLLGCDYSDGVPGVGKQTALKLLTELSGEEILQRFKSWGKEKVCHDSATSIEKQIFRKAMKIDGFPNEEVIDEFLVPRDKLEEIIPKIQWEYPDLVNLQRFCFKHMEWPEDYTLSKVLGIATSEYIQRIPRNVPLACPLIPERLVKPKIKQGVPLCEVEWRLITTVDSCKLWNGYPGSFITLESQQDILVSLPALVEEYEKLEKEKKSKGKKKVKKPAANIEKTNESDVDTHEEAQLTHSSGRQETTSAKCTVKEVVEMKEVEIVEDNANVCLDVKSSQNMESNLITRKQKQHKKSDLKNVQELNEMFRAKTSISGRSTDIDIVDDVVESLSTLQIGDSKESNKFSEARIECGNKLQAAHDLDDSDRFRCLSLKERLLNRTAMTMQNGDIEITANIQPNGAEATNTCTGRTKTCNPSQNELLEKPFDACCLHYQTAVTKLAVVRKKQDKASITSQIETDSAVAKHEESILKEAYFVNNSMDNLFENPQSLSTDSLVLFDSPAICNDAKEDSNIYEQSFDSDQYMESLRRKFNVSKKATVVDSPKITSDSPQNFHSVNHDESTVLPLMERLRARSLRDAHHNV